MTCCTKLEQVYRHIASWMGVTTALAVLGTCAADLGAEDMVITNRDFPLEVGRKWVFATHFGNEAEKGRAELAITGTIKAGNTTLSRCTVSVDGFRVPDMFMENTPAGLMIYESIETDKLNTRFKFPLKKGLTYEYKLGDTQVRARIEGPEEVEVPAGKFTCLKRIEEHNTHGVRVEKLNWVAPGIGFVKSQFTTERTSTWELAEIKRPTTARLGPGDVLLSNFDSGDPLGSPLFTPGRWQGVSAARAAVSICEIEPAEGALGTLFSLKWVYHEKDAWANVAFLVAGAGERTADLTAYDVLSFHVKGLSDDPCNFLVQSVPAGGTESANGEVPFQVTPQWERITIDLKEDPRLKSVNFAKTRVLGFGRSGAGYHSNVLWIDEIVLHRAK